MAPRLNVPLTVSPEDLKLGNFLPGYCTQDQNEQGPQRRLRRMTTILGGFGRSQPGTSWDPLSTEEGRPKNRSQISRLPVGAILLVVYTNGMEQDPRLVSMGGVDQLGG